MATNYYAEPRGGPKGYCWRLASYIKDPARVEALCRREWGSAPSREWIEGAIAHHNRPLEQLEPLEDDDGSDWRPAGKVAMRKQTRPSSPLTDAERDAANRLINGVVREFGVRREDITGPSREWPHLEARSVVAAALRHRGWSYPKIGYALGKRHHTSIMNLLDKLFWYERRDPKVARSIARRNRRYDNEQGRENKNAESA